MNKKLDPQIAEGREFLQLLQTQIIEKCIVETEQFITRDLTISKQVEHLGTTLSLLDRLASCYWGCHKGDHMKQYLLGRANTSASAAWILTRHGHYDAALGIARDIGEIANLFMLFSSDAGAFERWKNSGDRVRMNDFKPSKVREALGKLNAGIPVGKTIYKVLSERATHVTPNTRPELHSHSNHPFPGGTFQEDGVRMCITHIGFAIGKTALTATLLLRPAERQAESIYAAASALIDSSEATQR